MAPKQMTLREAMARGFNHMRIIANAAQVEAALVELFKALQASTADPHAILNAIYTGQPVPAGSKAAPVKVQDATGTVQKISREEFMMREWKADYAKISLSAGPSRFTVAALRSLLGQLKKVTAFTKIFGPQGFVVSTEISAAFTAVGVSASLLSDSDPAAILSMIFHKPTFDNIAATDPEKMAVILMVLTAYNQPLSYAKDVYWAVTYASVPSDLKLGSYMYALGQLDYARAAVVHKFVSRVVHT